MRRQAGKAIIMEPGGSSRDPEDTGDLREKLQGARGSARTARVGQCGHVCWGRARLPILGLLSPLLYKELD